MTADELLLQWAQVKVPEWLDEQLEVHSRYKILNVAPMHDMAQMIRGATLEHIKHCGPRIYAVDHSWECGCYSEYTRDDDWVVHTYVRCYHGLITEMRLVVRTWEMPEVIQQLAEMDEGCAYDDPDY